jgi:serine phosphatase RsbU (regulator of sigma subunit)/streptogramin lyase
LNHVRTILEDAEGNFWVGTDGGGLDYFNPILGKFKHFRNNKRDPYSIASNNVWKVYQDRKGRVWIGTFGGGLNLFDPPTGTFVRYQHIIGNSESLSDDKVTTIFEDHLGTLWIGTFGGGLNRWDDETQSFTNYKNIKNDPNTIGDNRIYSIIEDSDGILWIGTKGNLNKFDRATSKFSRFGIEQGLPNNVIMGILEDESGNLWISTNNGIAKFNKYSEYIRNYDVKNGLQSNEFLVGSFCKGNDGKMYFGGIKGLNAFYPDSVKNNPNPPQMVITDFKLFNTSVIPGPHSPLKQHITKTKMITLTYMENAFTFEFAALHYSQPEKNQYSYMMENFDAKWIVTDSKHRYATYTNLDPGRYVFRVKGANSDGIWNEEGTSIIIIIEPPFWQTTWFRALVVIFIVVSIYSIYRARIRRIEKQKEKLEKLVRERTAEVELQKEEIAAQRDDLEMQNQRIEMQNEQIKSSIRYALTIQNAILPIEKNMASVFDFFTIFKPKDIVSGDFYWFSQIKIENGLPDKIFIAAVDCTGHGVPGAFMSMIGSRLLSEIVNERKIFIPNQILEELNKGVRTALKQDQTDNHEGMDVCLCLLERLDNYTTKVTFSGAKRPLFYFKQDANEVSTLKGDRKSIGGIPSKLEDAPFTNKELVLAKGDLIYLTSDGIIDQNSPNRERFGSVRFMDTIKNNVRLPMNEQRETMETTLDLYQMDAEQRDDITVIGIRL